MKGFDNLCVVCLALVAAGAAVGAPTAEAGGTPAPAQLLKTLGTSLGIASGDYVSDSTSAAGLNTFYRFFVEVPPGVPQLVVEIFDAESKNDHDVSNKGDKDCFSYTLLDPAGNVAAGPVVIGPGACGGSGACGGCNNTWVALLTQANPVSGHWQVRVDSSTAGGGGAGDDVNAYGIRAHDGNPGAGGTELALYAHSFLGAGSVGAPPAATTHVLHPYVTSGCAFDSNNFDADDNTAAGDGGSIVFTSPATPPFSQSFPNLSGGTVWANQPVTGWVSDASSRDAYGTWTTQLTARSPTGFDANTLTYYLGSFTAADPPTGGLGPPPSAQPEAGTLRVYLPTDAGSRPLKPYLDQQVTHSAGPNPPVSGVTSRVTVTVRVVNPTSHPVTFGGAAGDVVTARVPGGGAVYAGTPQLSQGVVVSQPAAGGTGDVVWNPGTVAAGATALIAYDLDVTPTAAGQRIPVTGTPAAAGTVGRFVDETCSGAAPACTGARLAGATFTFGPLCELAVSEGLATHATVAAFELVEEGGTATAHWRTTSEAGTLGFYLERFHPDTGLWERVSEELIAAMPPAPQGAWYRWADPDASLRDQHLYRLVEIESGGTRVHGPFRRGLDRQALESSLELIAGEPSSRRARPAIARPVRVETTDAARAGERPVALHLGVGQAGLYHLETAVIAELLDQPETQVRRWLERGRLALSHRGRPVAWLAEPGGAGLLFYGEGPAADVAPFTTENVYRLEPGRGLSMARLDGSPRGPVAGDSSFADTLHTEVDRFAATVLPLDPDGDFWFWQFVTAGHPSFGRRSFELEAPDAAPGPEPASLTVELQGATATAHHVEVTAGGVLLGEGTWQGIARHRLELAVDPGLVAGGTVNVEVTGRLDPGVSHSIFYLDSFDLTYRRRHRARADRLAFAVEEPATVAISGFSTPEVQIFEVTDPLAPRQLAGAQVVTAGDGSFELRFAAAGGRYLALGSGEIAAPRVTPDFASDLKSRANGAEYLVIAPRQLLAGAAELAEHRRRRGLTAMVVELADVYDEFRHGLADPRALADLLALAHRRWQQPPRYVALLGAGTLDYRNLLGLGGNLLPPLLAATPSGLFAADGRLGDLDGDGAPEMAVGRLPVTGSEELDAYLDKLTAFEAAGAGDEWVERALLAADNPEGGADFGADSAAATALAGYRTERIFLGELPLGEARGRLAGALGEGLSVVHYLGHGGLDRLASEGLLTTADVATLPEGAPAPLVAALTCAISRFEVPGFPSLGAALVAKPAGGATAVWAPSGLSLHAPARRLGARFLTLLEQAGEPILGDLILQALSELGREANERPELTAMLSVYNLLGDPALAIPRPAAAGPPIVAGSPPY